jgi:SAM-dependent methyltransferase
MLRFVKDLLLRDLLILIAPLALTGCASVAEHATQSTLPPASPAPTEITECEQEPPDTIDRPTGKPYTGDLSTFEDPERDQKLQVNRVMDVLGIKEGSSVADIGAGSGWFTVRAARRVGNGADVYAVDINRDYLDYIDKRAKRESLANVRVIQGKDNDPLLPEKSVDAVLLMKTYHEIAQPIQLLKRTRTAMRAGALLGIIDRNGNGDHGIDKDVVIKEVARAGFVLVNQYDFVKPDRADYFLVFRVGP